jgi:hypothetical protein
MPSFDAGEAPRRSTSSLDTMFRIALLFFAIVSTTASSLAMAPEHMDTNVAKVSVFTDGRITLNGRSITLAGLHSAFTDLAKTHGVVWYYREASSTEPHPNAMLVIQEIVAARLPVSMSTKPDYSDVVRSDGTTAPR